MFLTWKVSTTSLPTTSRSSWWIQKAPHCTTPQNSIWEQQNSCPTSQVPGLEDYFQSRPHQCLPDVTAQLLEREKGGRAVAQGKQGWSRISQILQENTEISTAERWQQESAFLPLRYWIPSPLAWPFSFFPQHGLTHKLETARVYLL